MGSSTGEDRVGFSGSVDVVSVDVGGVEDMVNNLIQDFYRWEKFDGSRG
jgi:hypothetical protein